MKPFVSSIKFLADDDVGKASSVDATTHFRVNSEVDKSCRKRHVRRMCENGLETTK